MALEVGERRKKPSAVAVGVVAVSDCLNCCTLPLFKENKMGASSPSFFYGFFPPYMWFLVTV